MSGFLFFVGCLALAAWCLRVAHRYGRYGRRRRVSLTHPGRPPIPPMVRQAVYDRDGHRCRWCGSPYQLQVDHMFPWSRGGTNDLGNLQTLCRTCNMAKGAAVMRWPHIAPWVSGERIAA